MQWTRALSEIRHFIVYYKCQCRKEMKIMIGFFGDSSQMIWGKRGHRSRDKRRDKDPCSFSVCWLQSLCPFWLCRFCCEHWVSSYLFNHTHHPWPSYAASQSKEFKPTNQPRTLKGNPPTTSFLYTSMYSSLKWIIRLFVSTSLEQRADAIGVSILPTP